MMPFPFKSYSQATPSSLFILCPEVITMARAGSGWGGLCDITRDQPCLVPCLQVQGHTSPLSATSHAISAHHAVSEMVLVLASVSLLRLCLYVFFSERETQRNPGEGALRRALSNSAESTRAYPKQAWEQVALAHFYCCAVHDTEVSRRW